MAKNKKSAKKEVQVPEETPVVIQDVDKLERGIVAIKDEDGNRILLKKFAQAKSGTSVDTGDYKEVHRFKGKTMDDYMVRLEDYKEPVRVTGIKKMSDDALLAELKARGIKVA